MSVWLRRLSPLILLVGLASGASADEPEASQPGTVTIYTKSGEVLSGVIVERTPTTLVVERQGNRFRVSLQDAERIDEGPPAAVALRPMFSTAVVTYQYSGWQSGSETVYLDRSRNRGALKRTLTKTILGTSRTTPEWLIHDGSTVFYVDVEKRVAMTALLGNDATSDLLGYWGSAEPSLGEEIILDRSCRVLRQGSKTACMWQGIPLRVAVVHPMGEQFNFEQRAVSLEVDGVLPEEPFVVPVDFTLKTMEHTMEELGTMMQDLGQRLKRTDASAKSPTSAPASDAD